MKKTLLFIDTQNKNSYLKIAKDNGYNVISVNKQNSLELQDSSSKQIICDPRNSEETIMRIIEFSQKEKIHGVIPLHEQSVELTAIIANILGLPGLNIKSAVLCRNKFLCCLMLEKQNIPVPSFFLCENLNDLTGQIKRTNLDLPVIIKPLKFSGSSGVTKLCDFDEIPAKTNLCLKERENASCKDSMTDNLYPYWLVEKFIDGFEISVQTLTFNGETTVVAIHDKVIDMKDDFSERFVLTPSPRINTSLECTIDEISRKILKVLDFNFGIAHLEFRIVNGIPILIEVNARLGGGMTNEIVKHSVNVDLFKLLLEMCTGIAPKIKKAKQIPIAVERIHASKGTILSIEGAEHIKVQPNVVAVKLWKKNGDEIRTPTRDVVGAIMTTGQSPEEALNAVQKYGKELLVTIAK